MGGPRPRTHETQALFRDPAGSLSMNLDIILFLPETDDESDALLDDVNEAESPTPNPVTKASSTSPFDTVWSAREGGGESGRSGCRGKGDQ